MDINTSAISHNYMVYNTTIKTRIAPNNAPSMTDSTIDAKPIVNEIRPACVRHRVKMSRPSWSVPSQCERLGGLLICVT